MTDSLSEGGRRDLNLGEKHNIIVFFSYTSKTNTRSSYGEETVNQ